jgi:hypothetical protein
MKAYYLLAPLGAIALAGCTVYRPVAYEPAVVTTPAVAVAPTYVAPSSTVVLGAGADPKTVDSDADGYSNAVDRYPNDARWH